MVVDSVLLSDTLIYYVVFGLASKILKTSILFYAYSFFPICRTFNLDGLTYQTEDLTVNLVPIIVTLFILYFVRICKFDWIIFIEPFLWAVSPNFFSQNICLKTPDRFWMFLDLRCQTHLESIWNNSESSEVF